ncbi:hypothetical protein ACJJTC_003547 [Scirpophaga incertulas]
MGKRSAEEKREHYLRKLRKIEKKIEKCAETEENRNSVSPAQSTCDIQLDTQQESSPSPEECCSEKENDQDFELDESVLSILGDLPNTASQGQSLHREVANRWSEILKKGLTKEIKDDLFKQYPVYKNCEEMKAPELNPEVGVAISEMSRKRDTFILKRQQQISTILSCLGSTLQLCIGDDFSNQKLSIIKKLNDASRLLCDSFYLDTRGRRSLILSNINKEMREFLKKSETCNLLFGENLGETIKNAKSVKKVGSDLRLPLQEVAKKNINKNSNASSYKNAQNNNNKTLNWRGPPRQYNQTQSAGGPSQPYKKPRIDPKKRTEYQRQRK